MSFNNDKRGDEFYTNYADVANMIRKVDPAEFEGAVVFCPADDYRYSAFSEYFKEHFWELKLQALISSCYIENGNGIIDIVRCNGLNEINYLEGDGDFRSEEIAPYWDIADVVVTNPPFSIKWDFWDKVKNKKHLFIGPNTMTYAKRMINYFVEGKEHVSGMCNMKEAFIGNILYWYTNMKTLPKDKKIIYKKIAPAYNKAKLNNVKGDKEAILGADIFECNRIADISDDEALFMVPITIFSYDYEDEFDIIGSCTPEGKFTRIVIRRKHNGQEEEISEAIREEADSESRRRESKAEGVTCSCNEAEES